MLSQQGKEHQTRWHWGAVYVVDWVQDGQRQGNASHTHDWPSPITAAGAWHGQAQAWAPGSSWAVPRNARTLDALLHRRARHSRHHISPLRWSPPLIIARCQQRPLIRSARGEAAVCLSSSFAHASVSCRSAAHAMEILGSCSHHPACLGSPRGALPVYTQLLAKARLQYSHLAYTSLIYKAQTFTGVSTYWAQNNYSECSTND